MLKIIVKGEPLDLKADMTFEYRIKNPFFEDKIIPVPATYSFAIPLTSRNNRLLSYPMRLNQIVKKNEFEAKIIFGSVVIAQGILVRKKATQNGDINMFFKAQMDEGLLDKPLCELPLKEYYLSDGDYLENLHRLCERSFEGEVPFALPMLRISSPSNKVALWGMEKCDYKRIAEILKWFGRGRHKVISPDEVYVNAYSLFWQTLPEGNKYYFIKKEDKLFDRIAPFPYLWHIVEVVLASLDISKNPFKDGGILESLVVSATYCPTDNTISPDKPFKLNKSLSNYNTGRFLKEVFKGFGFCLNRLKGKTSIISYDEMLEQQPLADWSDILIDGWSIEDAKQEELVSGVDSERPRYTPENEEKRNIKEVDSPYYIMYQLYLMANNLNVDGVEYKSEDIPTICWYVSMTGEYYYSYFDEDSGDYWIEYKGVDPLQEIGKKTSNLKKKNRKSSLKIPIMTVDFAGELFAPDYTKAPINGVYSGKFDVTVFTHRYTYLPFISAERNKRDFTPALLSYTGKESSYIPVKINNENVAPHPRYPFATTNGYDAFSADGFDFEDAKSFSNTAKVFFEKERCILKGKVLLTEKQVQKLTGVDVIRCNGKKWLLKEISIPIKSHKIYPAQVTLVEIPDLNLSFPDFDVWA